MGASIGKSSPCSNIKAPAGLSVFTASVSACLSLTTIAGNLLICLAVYKDPHGKLRTPFMFFLVNLALSDLIVGCLAMPISVATHTMEILGTKQRSHVDLILVIYFISATASLLNFSALSVDRYFAVIHPLTYRRTVKYSRCIAAAAVIWLFALSLPMLYFVTGYMTYLMIFAHTGIAICAIMLIFTYFKIFTKLRRQAHKFAPASDSAQSCRARNAEKKVTRMYMTAFGAFSVLFIPVVVMIYVLKFCENCNCRLRHVLRDLQFLFALSSSAVNPFICTLQLTPFRKALLKIFSSNRSETRQDRSGLYIANTSSCPPPPRADNIKSD